MLENKSKIYPVYLLLRLLIVFSFVLCLACSQDDPDPSSAPIPAAEFIDLSYGTDPRQTMDVYLPIGRNAEKTPLIIYIHGGSWIDGSKSEFLPFRSIFEQYFPDYAFVAINYRLFDFSNNSNGFPTQENDVIAAIQYIESKQDEWDINDEIILVGASAGGHLALLHAYKHQEIGNIRAVMALFPPTDLTALFEFNSISANGLTVLLGGTPETNPEAYLESSPVNFIDSNTVPSIFFHGTDDSVVPISQSDILASKLSDKGVKFQFEVIQGQGHGFNSATYAASISAASIFINQIQ